jgi:probable HAF family extracellular repeat protein
VKVPFPRSFKAWLVAAVSLVAVTLVSIAPIIRPRAQSLPTTYTFTDLDTLGGTYSKASGINNCGQVVGESSLTGVSPTHPFIWRDLNGNLVSDSGEMKDLGTLGGVRGSATDINASGLVVGSSTISASEQHAFRWFDMDGDGVSDPGELNDLGVLPNYSTHGAFGVNDNGQIVGSAENENGASAFRWNANTGLELLANLNGVPPSHGHAINNSSHIAGYAALIDHAFIFNGTTNIDLGTFGGSRSIAYDINASGHAVGFADVTMGGAAPPRHAFKWNGTALQDLGVLPGGMRSQAYSINSSGIVVGYSEVIGAPSHAFVHDGTQMYDLNTLVTNLPVGWTLVEARGINDGGQIVGHGTTLGGETHAFLLTPTIFTPTCSPTVTVTVSPASVSEDGATNLTYTFTRAPVTNSPVTVRFSTSGDATRAVDYAVSGTGVTYDPNTGSGTIVFAAGEISKSVIVDPTTDFAVEPNETVVLTITAETGYIVGSPSSATGTITNDDSIPSVSVSVAPTAAAEDGATNLVYTFTRNSTIGSQTVNFSVGGTAAASTDYSQTGAASFTASTGTVTFANGSSTATVTINPSSDTTVESDETVILTLTTDASYSIGSPGAATGTISNDDTDVILTLSPSSVTESDTPNLVYTFARTGVTTGALTVNFSVTGTATFNTDYTQTGAATFSASAGTVTLSAGSSFATVTLDPTPDFIHEGGETVTLTVTPGTGYNVGSPSSMQGTITDDDPTPTIQITNVTAPEPNPGASTSFTFIVSLTNPSSSQITVNYATDTNGATATGGASCGGGVDFISVPSTGLTFSAGETSKQVSVTVCGDNSLEPDETFFVNLSGNSANSVLPANTKGTGTITPQAPTIFTEAAGPTCPAGNCAIAIDSVTFVRAPFKLTNDWNLTPSDRATRIILVTSNLGMTQANLASGILSVHIDGSAIPPENIENVGTVTGVAGLSASYIIVKLPANLSNPSPGPNNKMLVIKMGSATSNATILSITP